MIVAVNNDILNFLCFFFFFFFLSFFLPFFCLFFVLFVCLLCVLLKVADKSRRCGKMIKSLIHDRQAGDPNLSSNKTSHSQLTPPPPPTPQRSSNVMSVEMSQEVGGGEASQHKKKFHAWTDYNYIRPHTGASHRQSKWEKKEHRS